MNNTNTVIILVNPQMGENIGAVMRAMANFSLEELRLVNPRDGWPNEKAVAMASGAMPYLNDVQVYSSLNDAIADCHAAYATTARPRDMEKSVLTPSAVSQRLYQDTQKGQKSALVFGAERTGLENDDVSLCHHIVEIPVNENFKSLNLAQAVIIMAYAVFTGSSDTLKNIADHKTLDDKSATDAEQTNISPPAPYAEFDNFMHRLDKALAEKNFYKTPEMRPSIRRNLQNMLLRSNLTEQELKTLHGVLTTLSNGK